MEGSTMEAMKKKQDPPLRLWLTALFLTALGIVLSFVVGCAPQVVEKEIVRIERDTIHTSDSRRDSIYRRDSVYITDRWIGDTLLREKVREIVHYRAQVIHDTILRTTIKANNAKTIREKPKSLWSKIKTTTTPIIIIIVILFALMIWAKWSLAKRMS